MAPVAWVSNVFLGFEVVRGRSPAVAGVPQFGYVTSAAGRRNASGGLTLLE